MDTATWFRVMTAMVSALSVLVMYLLARLGRQQQRLDSHAAIQGFTLYWISEVSKQKHTVELEEYAKVLYKGVAK
jgi:hypothetical protein